MRMIQRGRGAHFALEPFERCSIGGDRAGKKLDGHRAIQTHVPGLINFPHSALLQEREFPFRLVGNPLQSAGDGFFDKALVVVRVN